MPIERRGYKRHPISGRSLFQTESAESRGELVDISRGGTCIRSKIKPLEGEEIAIRFAVKNHSEAFKVRGIVLRVQSDSWAVLFFEETMGLVKLLWSLDSRANKQVPIPIGT